jgi:hypothetical protein
VATLTLTFTAGQEGGRASFAVFAQQIIAVSENVPDVVSSGASTVLTIDNGPSAGVASVQITAGPYQTSKLYV